MKRPKIGIYGGTFDPVHEGHVLLALHVVKRCQLDHVLFTPAPNPPHKNGTNASFPHRVSMLRVALADIPRLSISLIEARLSPPSYTLTTVQELRKKGKEHFSLIIGADSLLDFRLWYGYEQLLALVEIIVVSRTGITDQQIIRSIVALDPGFTYNKTKGCWTAPSGAVIRYLNDIQLPISSTEIRHQLISGQPVKMVPKPVLQYIRDHQLYSMPEVS